MSLVTPPRTAACRAAHHWYHRLCVAIAGTTIRSRLLAPLCYCFWCQRRVAVAGDAVASSSCCRRITVASPSQLPPSCRRCRRHVPLLMLPSCHRHWCCCCVVVAVTGAAVISKSLMPPSRHSHRCRVAVAGATVTQPLLPTRLLSLVSPSLLLLLLEPDSKYGRC